MASFLNDIFGSKPTVPAWVPIDIGQQQQTAISNNQAALPGASTLAAGVNTFNEQQLTQMLSAAVPGLADMESSVSKNITAMLHGELPADVQGQVQRSVAAQSLGGGYSGSGLGRNLLGRDLGLTSLQITQQGLGSAESWLSTVRHTLTPELMSPTSMFFTPQQQLAFATEERNAKMSRDWMQSQISAMPDPVLSGINAEVMSLAAAYMGGSSKKSDYTQSYSGVNNGGFDAQPQGVGSNGDYNYNATGPESGMGGGVDPNAGDMGQGDFTGDFSGFA